MSKHLHTLHTALDQLGDLVGRVSDSDLDKPTPCSDWTVADLLDHTIWSVNGLAVATAGGQPDFAADPPHVDDPAAAYAQAADALRGAWEQADAAADARWNTAEVAVHGWDLAQALGVPSDQLDDAVAEDALAFMSTALTSDKRGDAFAPERDAPDGAGPYEQLVAFAGREPIS